MREKCVVGVKVQGVEGVKKMSSILCQTEQNPYSTFLQRLVAR